MIIVFDKGQDTLLAIPSEELLKKMIKADFFEFGYVRSFEEFEVDAFTFATEPKQYLIWEEITKEEFQNDLTGEPTIQTSRRTGKYYISNWTTDKSLATDEREYFIVIGGEL